jgi:hypothetical protein
MTRRLFHVGLILIVFACPSIAQDRQTPLPNVLAALHDTPGFETAGSPILYDSTTLDNFDKIVSQTLKLYGTRSVAVEEGRIAGNAVKVTLFQMLDSPAAYGVYTSQRTAVGGGATPVVYGAASFQREDQIHFWQSNYAVRIEGGKEVRDQVAKSLSRSILGRSQKPPVSAYLPAENLVEGSERYLLHEEGIDPALGIDAGKLGFDSSAEAAKATYRVDGKSAQLLLLLYPTQHIAKKYADEMDAITGSSAFRKRVGPLVAIVYGSSNEGIASSILGGVNHGFKVTWEEPLPGLGVSTMLITIFTFIAVALVFTTIAGVSYGGVRVFVKSRYPNRIFDRPEAMEIIQLKLAQGVTERQISGNSGTERS